jgi:transposase-like protein
MQVEGDIIVRQLTDAVYCCPHCESHDIAKAGSKDGRKRYKCKNVDCGKSFNALTGTSFANLHMPEKHLDHAKYMVQKLTIREVADLLDIDIHTAFRWRHRFLEAITNEQPLHLGGIVEADETYFPLSFKGQRDGIPRKSKKRGTPAEKRGLSDEQIPVLVARDRSSGATLTTKLQSRKAKDIGAVLLPVLEKDAVLCTDGNPSYRLIAKTSGIEVKSTPVKKSAGIYHIQNVNSYDSRLKGWCNSFNGVATKYLANYLGWHRLLDKSSKSLSGKKFLESAMKKLP